jgi:hypothetical protein
MAEMIFRIPSRTVQYGYVELPLALEAGLSPEMIAAAYVSYVYAFQKEEEAAVKRIKDGVSAPVSAPLPDDDDAVVDAAADALDKGLGGVTEVPEDGAVAPWATEAEAPKPKPWEKNQTAGGVDEEW